MTPSGVSDRVSRHFRFDEFKCSCRSCVTTEISQRLVTALQTLRDKFGGPIFITSGVRCEAHNRAVGSKDTSLHLEQNGALAADIAITSATHRLQILRLALTIPAFRGFGIGPDFMHLDVRETSPKMWTY